MAKTIETHVNLGLGTDSTSAIVEILKKGLADQHVLYVKTRNFHWNVTGPDFAQLHKLFDDQYNQLAEAIDATAERIRMLGSMAPGAMSAFLGQARLTEHEGKPPKASEMVAELVADHESIIRQLRQDIDTVDDDLGDVGTADFLTGQLQDHEKMAWFLRAHLE
jgi:starvation-inducible DNA-binding protein